MSFEEFTLSNIATLSLHRTFRPIQWFVSSNGLDVHSWSFSGRQFYVQVEISPPRNRFRCIFDRRGNRSTRSDRHGAEWMLFLNPLHFHLPTRDIDWVGEYLNALVVITLNTSGTSITTKYFPWTYGEVLFNEIIAWTPKLVMPLIQRRYKYLWL